MLILFFKAARDGLPDNEPIEDKMRRILESHVEDAETDEERERAARDLSRLLNASHR